MQSYTPGSHSLPVPVPLFLIPSYWLCPHSPVLFTLVPILILLLFSSVALSETHVSGEISGTWDPSGNPWIVDSACVVPSGQILDILPGCEIQIEWWVSPLIRVDGELNAIGTVSDSIRVTAEWADYDINCFELTTGGDLQMQYLRYTADDPGVFIQGCEGQGPFSMSDLAAPLGEVNIYKSNLLLHDLQLYELMIEGHNNTASHTVCQQTLRLVTDWDESGIIEFSHASNIAVHEGTFELQTTSSDSIYARRCSLMMDSCTVNMFLELDCNMSSGSLSATDCQLQEIEAIYPVNMNLTNCTFSNYSEWMSGGAEVEFQSCRGNSIDVSFINQLTLIDCQIDEEVALGDDVNATITDSQINRVHGWGVTGLIMIQDSQLNGLYSRSTSGEQAVLNIDHCLFLLVSEDDEITIGRQQVTMQNNSWLDTRPGVQPVFRIEGESEVVMQNNVTQGGRYVFEVDPESSIETDFNIYTDYHQFENPDYQGNYYVTAGVDDLLLDERVICSPSKHFALI